MRQIVLFSCVLLTFSFLSFPLGAECISSPNCTDLGYDKTSCPSGDSILKCPFDTSKLKCIPLTCETIGKKTCGENCVPSNFTGCCSESDCSSGQICNDNTCIEVICAIGDIYYSDKTCSADLVSGKTPIGVVGYVSNGGKNGLVVAKVQSSSILYWATETVDLSCISNASGSDGGANDPTYNPNVRADRNGKSNTACMMTQVASSGAGKYPAGEYCNGLSVEGVTGWYLPAGGELYDVIVTNLSTVNSGLSKISGAKAIPTNTYHWSSSEYSDGYGVWALTSNNGDWGWYTKDLDRFQVRCVLAF